MRIWVCSSNWPRRPCVVCAGAVWLWSRADDGAVSVEKVITIPPEPAETEALGDVYSWPNFREHSMASRASQPTVRRYWRQAIVATSLVAALAWNNAIQAVFKRFYPAPDDPKHWRVVRESGGGGIDSAVVSMGMISKVCAKPLRIAVALLR